MFLYFSALYFFLFSYLVLQRGPLLLLFLLKYLKLKRSLPAKSWMKLFPLYRSTHPEVFLKKAVLKICSKFTGEHPCRSAISIKLHIFRTSFLKNSSGRLLLIVECPYPLRNELRFKSRNVRTVRYERAVFVGSRIWSYMPSELKESMWVNEFRSKIKT